MSEEQIEQVFVYARPVFYAGVGLFGFNPTFRMIWARMPDDAPLCGVGTVRTITGKLAGVGFYVGNWHLHFSWR